MLVENGFSCCGCLALTDKICVLPLLTQFKLRICRGISLFMVQIKRFYFKYKNILKFFSIIFSIVTYSMPSSAQSASTIAFSFSRVLKYSV